MAKTPGCKPAVWNTISGSSPDVSTGVDFIEET